jgi:iduronate 2-sulfatase
MAYSDFKSLKQLKNQFGVIDDYANYKMKNKYTSLLLLTIIAISISFFTFKQKPKPLNVLFITIDDLRPELGCFGSKRVISPNIDALAAEAAIFKNAYCNAAVCGPSRASLLTGLRPIPNKRFKNWNCRIDEETKGIVSLPQHFKNAGYHTVCNGKVMHVQDDSPDAWTEPAWRSEGNRGASFHHYNDYHDWADPASAKLVDGKKGPFYEAAEVEDEGYHDGEITEKTLQDLRRLAKQNKPFFLAAGFWRPHLPFNAPKKYWDLYDRNKIPLANNRFYPKNAPDFLKGGNEIKGQYSANEGFPDSDEFHRLSVHGYLASVSYIDAQIGKITKELKALGLWENTIIVILGDHGFHLGEHNFWGKHNTMDVSVKAPLIIRSPRHKSAQLNQNVEFVDIYPSLCQLTTVAVPEHCVGKSLIPIMEKTTRTHKPFVFTSYENAYAVKHQKFLYTEFNKGAEKMLYNHQNDPQENVNVVNEPKYKKVVENLHKQLEEIRADW